MMDTLLDTLEQRNNSQGNYRREVDYVSMAAVLLDPVALGNQTLLDPAFKQGYYEDTDLAFRLTANGYKVVYQPLAVVHHQEGTTFGTDAAKRKQALMKENRQVLLVLWVLLVHAFCCMLSSPD